MAEKVCEGPEPDSPFTVITQLSYSRVCAKAASVLGCRPSQILLSCTDPETNKQVPITSSTVLQYYVLVKRNLRTSQSHWLWLDVRRSGPEAESDHGEQPEEPQDEQQRGAEPQDGEQHDDLSTLSPPKRAAAAGMTMMRPSTINKNDFWHVSAAIFDGAKKDFQRRYHYAGQIMETDKGMVRTSFTYNLADELILIHIRLSNRPARNARPRALSARRLSLSINQSAMMASLQQHAHGAASRSVAATSVSVTLSLVARRVSRARRVRRASRSSRASLFRMRSIMNLRIR